MEAGQSVRGSDAQTEAVQNRGGDAAILPVPARQQLESSIEAAANALLSRQREDGHWSFEFEADATIPAEYILLTHYLGEEPDPRREAKIGNYLRRIQGKHGGWPLFHEGDFDMSASVKAYFALKMIGDDIAAPHMKRAREAILERGGAGMSNVFTRILLALYGVLTWRAAPVMPVEIMLLPRWFPFHMTKVSYWARTVMVPLFVLGALKPRARNRRGVGIDELFLMEPKKVGMRSRAGHQKRSWFLTFAAIDRVLRLATGPPEQLPRGVQSARRNVQQGHTQSPLAGEGEALEPGPAPGFQNR